jgi:hypothetical protein
VRGWRVCPNVATCYEAGPGAASAKVPTHVLVNGVAWIHLHFAGGAPPSFTLHLDGLSQKGTAVQPTTLAFVREG